MCHIQACEIYRYVTYRGYVTYGGYVTFMDEGGDYLIRVGTDVQAWALHFLGVNFARALSFER